MTNTRSGWLTGAAILCVALVAGCTNPQVEQRQQQAAIYNTELGIAYLQRGDLAVAKKKLDLALSENPDDPNVRSARALLFDRLGEGAQADREFRAALRLAPQNPDYQNNYAVYLCSNGRQTEGVKYFLQAARNPLYLTPAAAYTNAGVCLRSAHHDQEAAQMFHDALAVRANFAQAAWQLADMEFRSGHVRQARSEITGYLASYPETPELLLLAVKVMRAQHDELDAVLYARKLQLDFPDSAEAHALASLGHNPG